VPAIAVDEVLIRVEAAGVCGTDIHEVRAGPITIPVQPHPANGRTAPMTLGHEIVGIVEVVGAGAGLTAGSRVAPWPLQPCGSCQDCRAGAANRCRFAVALGMSTDGGFADAVVAKADGCAPVDPSVAVERAVLVEPFAVALHAAHLVSLDGRRVAVVGVGSLGRCAIEVALLSGAREVVAVSRSESGRGAALEIGAARALTLDEAVGLDADVVLEAAGDDAGIASAIVAARSGGHVVVIGAHGKRTAVDLYDLTVRELGLIGSVSHCYQRDFVAAAQLIGEGRLARTPRPMTFVTLNEAPMVLLEGSPTTKAVVVPDAPS
jgi:(R,R)-butanediol dehydrogenase/meso-butanediol dehydrogenase/diacetyl reductase